MSFISYTANGYDRAANQYIYTIVDSEFGAVDVGVGVGLGVGVGVGVAVAKEYSKRGLNVGRNLALLILYMHKEYRSGIDDIKLWQDEYCPNYVENWAMYAKERDIQLEKLLVLA